MLDVLLRAGSFITIILLGFFLRRIGFFKQEDFSLLSQITIRVTLPCAIVTSFSGKVIDPALLSLSILALACGLLYIIMGYLVNRNRDQEQQSFAMLNLPGYNVGNFVIPFAQSFLGPTGVIAVSIFDTGNAAICLGGAYSIAAMVKDGIRFSPVRIVRALLRSVPFVTYMLMLLLNIACITVPSFILSVAEIGANANAFMAMLMIGVGFHLELRDKSKLGVIVKLLMIRYGLAAVFSFVFYFLLPFSLEVRQALVILAFSPISSAIPGFTQELKGDVGLSSALNSLTMVISILVIVILLVMML